MNKTGRVTQRHAKIEMKVEELDFESALAELEAIVIRMDEGDLKLEASLKDYQRGMQLAAYCRKTLREAEQQVKILEEGVFKDFQVEDDSPNDSGN